MLQQYQSIKEQYPDCLLFFRLGDFYELFGDDAKIGSEVLHITLTARDKGGDGKIPMCGVPFHASENYIARLVNAGYKVAICEQMSEAGKGLVQREVVRVVTAGTLLRDESLTEAASQYILSLVIESRIVAGAAADLSTGEFKAFSFTGKPEEIIPLVISHFSPRECIVPRSLYDNREIISLIRREQHVNITCAHDWLVYIKDAEKMLKNHFHVGSLSSYGLANKPEAIKGAAALLGYLRYTQKGNLDHVTAIEEFHFTGHLVIDQVTLRNLEVIRTNEGNIEGSLFGVINQTVTAAGQRLLQDWLLHPITNKKELETRHETVAELLSRTDLVKQARETAGSLSDIERLVGRLSVGLGSPRDLRRLVDTLWEATHNFLPRFSGVKAERLRLLIMPPSPALTNWFTQARDFLLEEAKPTTDEGWIFKPNFHAELATLRQLTTGNQSWLQEFEERERQRTNIPKLKIVYSRAFGYAIEVGKIHKDKVPVDYVPRQTLVNAERFTCQELADYERKALSALDQMVDLEKQLFAEQIQEVIHLAGDIAEFAQRLAQIDVLLSFAYLAHSANYIEPEIVESTGYIIKDGRHPVVEQLSQETFVANNTELTDKRCLQLITGPNMAGKSTYIRQVALIVLLAHTGSFVPAKEAIIGITDRIFTRIGAHDNLRAGQSKFMVEMLETAHILHNATSRSLVILDEVGRGTSPEDGFALAWAVAEAFAKGDKGLVLFATHFHALKDLANNHPTVFNSHLAVAIDNEDLIFLRKVTSGPTDESYGIVVAEKAGVPKAIIQRAKQLASVQEKGKGMLNPNQLTLLAASQSATNEPSQIEEKIKNIDVDSLTPLEALNILSNLKKEI